MSTQPTCKRCGKPMVHNVPRLGDAGGFVHAETGEPLCERRRDGLTPEELAEVEKLIKHGCFLTAEGALHFVMQSNKELHQKLAEARKDSERLDKLEQLLWGENDLDVSKRDDGYHIDQIFNQAKHVTAPTLRQAIDAAMSKPA